LLNATIDIGTNTVLLLIAEWNNGKIKTIKDEARIARLGEGLHQFPLFLLKAQNRVLEVLKEYRALCDSLKVKKIAAVGTAAFRKSKNAPAFIARAEKEIGIRIEIISGDEEARLSFLSATRDFPERPNPVVLDIGGGSTEIISKENRVSLELGSVVLTERHLKHDPPLDGEVRALSLEIDRTLSLRPKPYPLNPTLIALAGTVTTLSAIKQKLKVWDGAKVQGSILTAADLAEMIPLFRRTTNEERKTIPGMIPGREDTLLAGTMILQAIMKKIKVDRVTVSDRGLRYGLFYEQFPYR